MPPAWCIRCELAGALKWFCTDYSHTPAWQRAAEKSFRKWQREGLRDSPHQPLDNGGEIDSQTASWENDEMVEVEKYKAVRFSPIVFGRWLTCGSFL